MKSSRVQTKVISLALIFALIFQVLPFIPLNKGVSAAEADYFGPFKSSKYASSDHFTEEYIEYTFVNNTLFYEVKTDGAAYDRYAVNIFKGDENPVNKYGSISQSTGIAAGSTSLSGFSDGIYEIYFYTAKKNESTYWGISSVTFFISGETPYFPVSNINRRAAEFLGNADPAAFLSIQNDVTTPQQKSEIKAKALDITKNAASAYEKVKLVHNFVAETIYYNQDAYNSGEPGNNDPYYVFQTGIAVCTGYADLTAVMLTELGIPCVTVLGMTSGSSFIADHAWNAAFVDNRWVVFDTTWDSGNLYQDGKKTKGRRINVYFDVNPEAFSNTHITLDFPDLTVAGLKYSLNVKGETQIGVDVSGCLTTDRVISIPAAVGDFRVTGIGVNAFSDNNYVEEIILPRGIQVIDMYAFWKCKKLEKINLPGGLTTIETAAFYDCDNLAGITIPEGVTKINDWTFANCENLTDVVLPNGLTSIGEYAFSSCYKIKSMTIPSSVNEIKNYAFYNTIGLAKLYFLGNAPSIGTNTFQYSAPSKVFYYIQGAAGFSGIGFPVAQFTPSATHKTVSFNINGGTGANSVFWAEPGKTASEALEPVHSKYKFTGWFEDPDGEGEEWDFSTQTVNGDMTLYAVWDIEKYEVTYHFDSGGTEVKTVREGSPIGIQPADTKTGCSFKGWYTKENGSGDSYTQDSAMPGYDLDLYPYFTVITPCDLFVSDIGTSPVTINDGDQILFYAVIRNQSNAPSSGNIQVDFYVDGMLFESVTTQKIVNANGFTVVTSSLKWNSWMGSHSVRAVVNRGKALPETNYSNNTFVKRIKVYDPQ